MHAASASLQSGSLAFAAQGAPPGAAAAATARRGAGTGSGRDALCGLRMPAGHSAPRASASPERCQGRSPALAAHQLASEVPVCSELCEQLCNTPGTTDS